MVQEKLGHGIYFIYNEDEIDFTPKTRAAVEAQAQRHIEHVLFGVKPDE